MHHVINSSSWTDSDKKSVVIKKSTICTIHLIPLCLYMPLCFIVTEINGLRVPSCPPSEKKVSVKLSATPCLCGEKTDSDNVSQAEQELKLE